MEIYILPKRNRHSSVQHNDLIPMAYSCLHTNKSSTKQNATLLIHFFFFFLSSISGSEKVVMLLTTQRGKNNPYTNIQSTKIPSFYSLHPSTNEKSRKSLLFVTANRLQYRTRECPLPSIITLPWNRNHPPVSKASIYVRPEIASAHLKISTIHQKTDSIELLTGRNHGRQISKFPTKKKSSLHVPLIHKRAPRRECDIEINRFSKTVFTDGVIHVPPILRRTHTNECDIGTNWFSKTLFTDGVIHVPPIHKWTPTSECDIETNWFSETLFTDGIN